MSATPEDLQASNTALQAQLAAAKAALAAATAPKTSKPSAVGAWFSKVGKALWAAVASTDAVKQEKSLFVLIVTRLLLSAGATEGAVQLVQLIVKAS